MSGARSGGKPALVTGALLFWCGSACSLSAQDHWVEAGLPFRFFQVHEIRSDDVTDALYFCGGSSIDNDLIADDAGIAIYQGEQWDTLGPINGTPKCAIMWGDTLVVGGYLAQIDGQAYPGCAGYVNGTWIPFGDFGFGSPQHFRILDGELFAVGGFEEVDGQVSVGLARREHGAWVSVGSPIGVYPGSLNVDVIKYGGQLIMAGGVSFNWTSAHGIAVLNDTTWQPLGPGILGNLGFAGALAIYNDELYVGGGIHVMQGNPCEGIVKWTGSEFVPVGEGVQNANNQPALNVGIHALMVHDGLLYASGTFWHAGGVPAMGVATWDGSNWCGLGGELEMPVMSMAFYHDSLYVAPLTTAEGLDVNCAAKYIGSYPDTCSGLPTSAINSTYPMLEPLLQLETDRISVRLPSGAERNGQLMDATGRLLGSRFGSAFAFPTTDLSPGVYVVRIEGFRPRRVFVP